MKKSLFILMAALFVVPMWVGAAASEQLAKDKKKPAIDDFFADYALEAPPEPISLPIVMYHQISRKPARLGTYVISEEEFEQDLKLFKDRGYTTIIVSDLINFAARKKPMPEKPIMLTFDDGFESDYAYAFPLLKKYGMKAIFSVVGKFTDTYSVPDVVKNIDYSYLSWDEIREMHESGHADFQSHTYQMHEIGKRRGALPKKYENDEEYQNKINEDLGKLNTELKEHAGIVPDAFTCPFGGYNDRLKEAVRKMGFSVIFTSNQKINTLTGDPEEFFRLNRFLRTHDKNMAELAASWDAAKK